MSLLSVLLYGPSGCGKTLLANMKAGEFTYDDPTGMTFRLVCSEILREPYSEIKKAFDALEQYGVAGLLIENIEELFSGLRTNLAAQQLLFERLRNPVSLSFFIATTRYPEILSSRELELFKDVLPVLYPDSKGRLEIFRVHTRGLILDPPLDLESLVQKTEWWSGAEITELIQASLLDGTFVHSGTLVQNCEFMEQRVNRAKRIGRMYELLDFTRDHCTNSTIQEDALLRYGILIGYDGTEDSAAIENDSVKRKPGVPHSNITILFDRMDSALERRDYSEVLHASASVFETLAKDVVGISVQNQTLGKLFKKYRKYSSLPNEVLDYILEIYKKRNMTPLAGHGSTKLPDVSEDTAIIICELTRAFVQIEYALRGENFPPL